MSCYEIVTFSLKNLNFCPAFHLIKTRVILTENLNPSILIVCFLEMLSLKVKRVFSSSVFFKKP